MKQQKDSLNVEFTQEQKKFNYTGSLGGLIGNSMTLMHLLYSSLQNQKHKDAFKKAITEYVNKGIVFMTNEDIEKAIKEMNKEEKPNE